MLSSCLQSVRVQQRKQRGQEAAGEHLVVVVSCGDGGGVVCNSAVCEG